ncbi:hypothetical protein [Actinomadura harenae]|uniref:Uncharacterized protein n=1 Tax=Actinomadura harenae TaxID=2483351 RepID=A0A3M2LRK6_9ACTN|nr:hypothetical protein [Actinomadura harenae]RMI37498.1 hypothetical protein EBO15_35635 [Actinomadura harenae]
MTFRSNPTEPRKQGTSAEGLHGSPNPRLVVLHSAAVAHRLPVEISTADNGRNYYLRLDRGRHAPARVFHGHRISDAGRDWFYGDGGEWIAESDDLTSVLVWLKGKHAGAGATTSGFHGET